MSGTKLSRRAVLKGSLSLAAASMLAACGGTATPAVQPTKAAEATKPAAAQPTKAAEPTKAAAGAKALEVWNANWGETYNAPMKSLGEEYEKASGVKINWAFNDQWQEKLLTAVAGGVPPDATYTNWVGLPTLAFQDTMLPLDDYFAASGIKSSDFIKAMIESCIYEGKTYSIPGGADFMCIVWNKDVYKAAGLDPEQPPKTLDEWVKHSEAIYKTDSAGNFERMGMGPTDPGLMYTIPLYDGKFYDANSKKITCNDAGSVKALEWMVGNAQKWNPEKVAAFTAGMPGYSQPNSGFSTGKQAYLFTGFWCYEALDKYAPDLQYGISFLPTLNGTEAERKNYLIMGWDYGIPKGAKSQDDAWKFIKYAFYDNAADLSVKTINGNCVLAQMPKFEEGVKKLLGDKNRMSSQFHVFSETGAAGTIYWPVIPVASRFNDEMTRAQDFAVRGEKKAQAALDECVKTTQDELDKAFKG